MIEVKIDSIRASMMSDHRVIILKDVEHERYLPIWIGRYEAEAIAISLQDVEVARPLTHDLLNNAIIEMGGDVTHIVVNDLRNDTFYARIMVDMDGRQVSIDSRPSDAIALAVRADATIFVEENVMAQASITPEADVTQDEAISEDDLSAFRNFINTLNLDDLPLQ
jgi:hypothetical protein